MWPDPVSGYIWKDLPGSGSQHELRFRNGTRQGALGQGRGRFTGDSQTRAWQLGEKGCPVDSCGWGM